jgi:hypothetical protein
VTVTNDFKLSEQCAKFAGLDFYWDVWKQTDISSFKVV